MAPKFMEDEDGDVPPCSIEWDIEIAKAWDAMKKKKYGGKAKGIKGVELFYESNPEKRPWWYKLCVKLGIYRV